MSNVRLSAFADEASPFISGQIEALKRNGISLLEIRGVDNVNISKISAEKAREIRKQLDDGGISVRSMGSPIGKVALDGDFDEHIEKFKRILEYADILGASRIRLFSFFPAEGEDRKASLEKVIERLDRFCELTPDHIILCHENEKNIFGENTESCLAIHKALPKIKAVFDPANFIQCGVNTLEAWSVLRDYVDYIHIKDALADGTVVPAGEGLGNIPCILTDYVSRGGSVMTLEPHLKVFSGLSELENGESVKTGVKVYASNDEAFDAACSALNSILKRIGEKS
ncbi:MAG: sugar phosphate isomerase/epimerase [Ruminococcaceae bacterium]|nr:sugar phosphate isomerase/epimerase [Oscillospiraceae bacterium]